MNEYRGTEYLIFSMNIEEVRAALRRSLAAISDNPDAVDLESYRDKQRAARFGYNA